MSKVIKTTAIIAVIMQIVHFVIGRFGVPIGLYLLGTGRMPSSTQGMFVYLIYNFFSGIIMIFIYVVFMILLLNAAGGKSENIAMEIVGIVLLSVVIPLVMSLVSLGFTYIYNYFGAASAVDMATISQLNSYSSIGSLFTGPSSVLMVLSMAFSISRKKFVIPLEYEKGYGVSDDYTGGAGTPEFTQQQELNQQYNLNSQYDMNQQIK